MKRLIFIFVSVALFATVQSQVVVTSVRHASYVGGGVSYPSHWATDLIAYYISEASYITESGGAITVWADSTDNSYDLSQLGVGSEQPTWPGTGDTVWCDGINDFMTDTFTLDQSYTVYIVCKLRSWADNATIFDGATASTGRFRCDISTPDLYFYAGSNSIGPLAADLDDFAIYRLVANGASSSIEMNNGTPATGDAGSSNAGGVSIGGRADGTGFSATTFEEIVVLNGTETPGEEADSYSYLNNKYSIY